MKRVFPVMAVFAAVAALAGGCDGPPKVTADRVRSDMSPELETIAMTRGQRMNNVARTMDTNLRELNDDWDRIFLLDRPLRTSRYPIP